MNTLNDFIEKQEGELASLWNMTSIQKDRVLPFLRSALRECAERTTDAVNLGQQAQWFSGSNEVESVKPIATGSGAASISIQADE
jgi:hypothetical protein